MEARCAKHHFEAAEAQCPNCGHGYCAECLVYPFGPHRPPLCVPCALVRGGVRRAGGPAPLSWRERRAQAKAIKRQNQEKFLSTVPDERGAPPQGPDGRLLPPDEDVAEYEPVTASTAPEPDAAIDWSTPFDAESAFSTQT
jgi:hypothetical protein